MSEIRIVREYPYPVEQVWNALTDPELIPRWTSTGRGGRPEGFVPVVGNRFRLIAKPTVGWRGIVDCEVLDGTAAHGAALFVGRRRGRQADVRHLPPGADRRGHPFHLRAHGLQRHRRFRHGPDTGFGPHQDARRGPAARPRRHGRPPGHGVSSATRVKPSCVAVTTTRTCVVLTDVANGTQRYTCELPVTSACVTHCVPSQRLHRERRRRPVGVGREADAGKRHRGRCGDRQRVRDTRSRSSSFQNVAEVRRRSRSPRSRCGRRR